MVMLRIAIHASACCHAGAMPVIGKAVVSRLLSAMATAAFGPTLSSAATMLGLP